jgi:ribokinase
MPKIVVVGSSNTDMVVKTPHIPAPGETVLGGEFIMAAGGKGANQAVAAARLGGNVTLIARVGRDVFGEQALAGFRREGLDIRYVVADPEAPSGVALIFVGAEGQNSIAVAPGANACLSPEDVRRAREAIEAADVVLLQLEIPLETVLAAAEIAHRVGVRVILNPAPAPPQPLSTGLLARVDVLTPNESEVGLLSGTQVVDTGNAERAARRLLEQGVGAVIATLGARGALVVTPDDQQFVPSFPVDVVDTTAAGDSFNGGLAVALAEGRSLRDAVRFASACGALATTRMGAQPSLPTADEVSGFMARSR